MNNDSSLRKNEKKRTIIPIENTKQPVMSK